jgi:hypothetical protein
MCTNGLPLRFGTLPNNLYIKYRADWNFFDRVQASNVEISTLLQQNQALGISYVQLNSYAEINSFTNGQMLHIRAYPDSNWNIVPGSG